MKHIRKLAPFDAGTGLPKVYFVPKGKIPFKPYLLALTTLTNGQVFHGQCKAYYECLLSPTASGASPVQPHQCAQFYKALMGRRTRYQRKSDNRAANVDIGNDADGFDCSRISRSKPSITSGPTTVGLEARPAKQTFVVDSSSGDEGPEGNERIGFTDSDADSSADDILNSFYDQHELEDGPQDAQPGQAAEEEQETIEIGSGSETDEQEPSPSPELEPGMGNLEDLPHRLPDRNQGEEPASKRTKRINTPDAHVEHVSSPAPVDDVAGAPSSPSSGLQVALPEPPQRVEMIDLDGPVPDPDHVAHAEPPREVEMIEVEPGPVPEQVGRPVPDLGFKPKVNSDGHRAVCKSLLPVLLQVLSDDRWRNREDRAQVREACWRALFKMVG